MKTARKQKTAKAAGSPRAPSRKAARGASVQIRRAYDEPGADDGLRILIDRLWPRGLAKTKLKVDAWPKHLAPSTELRRWYHGGAGSFAEFRRRYLAELKQQGESLDDLRALVRGHKVTLITATREPSESHAEVLRAAMTQPDED
jgi:uncharacterized protein YeaO (DUF488 family)